MFIVCDDEQIALEVVEQGRQPIVEPTSCPVCSAGTTRMLRGKEGAVTYCGNPQCEAAVFAKLDHWIGSSKKGVGILDIGDTMIKALWENKLLQDPADLYTLTVDAIQNVKLASGGKIGKSRATKIINNIAAKRQLSIQTFLGALGIELLGSRRVKILSDAAAGQLNSIDDWLDTEKIKALQIPGLGDTIRASIVAGIEENRVLIAKLRQNGVTVGEASPVVATEENGEITKLLFTGLSFCFTGTRQYLPDVERLGGTIKSGVSKGLDFLVQLDPLSTSVKTQKAESYGTQIIGVDYLKRAIDGQVVLGPANAVEPPPTEPEDESDGEDV